MKVFLISADANGHTDGVTYGQLLSKLPLTDRLESADVVVINAVCHGGYKFNHDLNKVRGKKLVLIDYLEYGWNWDFRKENRIGYGNLCPCTHTGDQLNEWGTLDLFIRENPPILTFKRELLLDQVSDTMIPIDFLAEGPAVRRASEAEFDARPLDVFYCWGYSHPDRPRVHGEIFAAMGNAGINVVDHPDMLGRGSSQVFPTGTWMTLFKPYYLRRPMSEIYALQRQAKFAINLRGAGVKCFRSSEAPIDTIMATGVDPLAYSYPWIDHLNCVQMPAGKEVGTLMSVLRMHRSEAYTIYLNCQENIDRYRAENYIPNYVLANIEKRLCT